MYSEDTTGKQYRKIQQKWLSDTALHHHHHKINDNHKNQPVIQKTAVQATLVVAFYTQLRHLNHINLCPTKHRASHFHQTNLGV